MTAAADARRPARLRVDRDACCGSGNCVAEVPELFDQDDQEGLVLLLAEEAGAELSQRARTAAGYCPTGAITVEET